MKMLTLEELKSDGRKFLENYQELDESAKLIAISYMRGLKDGKILAEHAESEKIAQGLGKNCDEGR